MYRWLSQKRPKYISIIRVSLTISLVKVLISESGLQGRDRTGLKRVRMSP